MRRRQSGFWRQCKFQAPGMLPLLRLLTAIADALVRAPWRVMRLFGQAVAFNPNSGHCATC